MDNKKIVREKDILEFQIERNFSRNSTAFLEILEEIARAGHKIDYAYYRKKVLDKTNDSKREILTLIDKLNI